MTANSKEPAYWYVQSDGIEQGPMSVSEIMAQMQAGTLTEDSLVRLDAWEKRVRLGRLGGAEEMRRLERGRESQKSGDLFLADDPVMQDAEVMRLEKRLRWIRRVELVGYWVIVLIGMYWMWQMTQTLGQRAFWIGMCSLVPWVVGWMLLCSIAAGAVSSALSSRCLWLDRREQRRGEKADSKEEVE